MKQAIHQIFARWGQSLTVAGTGDTGLFTAGQDSGRADAWGHERQRLAGRAAVAPSGSPGGGGDTDCAQRQGVPGVQQPPLRGGDAGATGGHRWNRRRYEGIDTGAGRGGIRIAGGGDWRRRPPSPTGCSPDAGRRWPLWRWSRRGESGAGAFAIIWRSVGRPGGDGAEDVRKAAGGRDPRRRPGGTGGGMRGWLRGGLWRCCWRDCRTGSGREEPRWEAVRWEKETGTFLRRGTLQCRALFLAQEQAEDGAFLDFILKGAMEQ